MNNKGEYPKMNPIASEDAGPPLTIGMIQRQFDYYRSPQYQIDREERLKWQDEQNHLVGQQIEAQYCHRMGITELTPELREELWSKLSERYCRAIGLID